MLWIPLQINTQFQWYLRKWIPCVESWAAWEIKEVMLKADGPAVRNLWIMDCNEACVTAAVRTKNIS